MTPLMFICSTVAMLVVGAVLTPFFVGQGGGLQDASATDSVADLELRQTSILRRWMKDEKASEDGDISMREWKLRQRYLTSRYVDCARRIAWIMSNGAVGGHSTPKSKGSSHGN
jgi:hypothetical protein